MVKFGTCNLCIYLCRGDVRMTEYLAHALNRHTIVLYLEYMPGWNWFYSMALPLAIYFVTVKQIATRGGENREA